MTRIAFATRISTQFCESACSVIGRIELQLPGNLHAGETQASRQGTNRQRLQICRGRTGEEANHPRRCEQAALSWITVRHRNPAVRRVLHHPCAVRVVPHTDGGRPNPISFLFADDRPRRSHNMGQSFEGLHHAQVVCRMHDWARAVGDEIEELHRRALAIEFREVTERAAADRDPRKGFPRCLVDFAEWRAWRLRPVARRGDLAVLVVETGFVDRALQLLVAGQAGRAPLLEPLQVKQRAQVRVGVVHAAEQRGKS